MQEPNYNRIDYSFTLDSEGKYPAVFSLFRKQTSGTERANILQDDRDFVGMIVNLSGHNHLYQIGQSTDSLPKGHYNFFYIPKGSGVWSLEEGINSIASIYCDPLFLPQFTREAPVLNQFLQAISKGQAAQLTAEHLPMPPEVLDSLSIILRDTSFTEKVPRDTFLGQNLRKMFVVGLTNSQARSKIEVSDRNLKRVQELYQYIADNLQFIKNTNSLGSRDEKRKFKQVFGTSVNETLMYERAKKAEELLLTTSLPLQEIGQRVGYRDQSAFSKAFHRRHGMSPSDFRLKGSTRQKS